MRIVDYVGLDDDLAFLSGEIQELLEQGGYEYADFYQYGIPQDIMNAAGFIRRGEDDPNIIPNYFEPFAAENIDIHFFTSELDGFCIFKADGDQDRPNLKP